MNYLLHLLALAAIYTAAASGLAVVWGQAGLLSLGHAALFSVGAYVYAVSGLALHADPWTSLALAAAGGLVLGTPLALASRRFEGEMFAIIALAFQVVCHGVLSTWTSISAPVGTLANLTGGPSGLTGISGLPFPGSKIMGAGSTALVSLLAAAAILGAQHRLICSPWGRLLRASKDDEIVARAMGKTTRRAKAEALTLAAIFAAIAGALYAGYIGYIDPTLATIDETIVFLAMVIVGGTTRSFGPLIGACIYVVVPEVLALVHVSNSAAPSVRLAIFGMLIVVFVQRRAAWETRLPDG